VAVVGLALAIAAVGLAAAALNRRSGSAARSAIAVVHTALPAPIRPTDVPLR
jgi:hypothetical protein